MSDLLDKKHKKTLKIKIKHPIQNFNDLDSALEGNKFKFKNKHTISIVNDDAQLDLLGAFTKTKNKIGGEIGGFKLFVDDALVVTAKNYKIKMPDLLKAQKALKDGDFLPLNKLLFGKPLDVKGSDGDDQVFGGPKSDKMDGRGGNDTLFGADGNDTLIGGPGNDFLYAGFGNDNLDGGSGQNVLHGDLGNDYFAFSALDGLSQVLDFGPGDYVGVARDVFPDIGPKGPIDPDIVEFNVFTPSGPDTRFFFTPTKGFYFDGNGNAPGGQHQIGQFSSGIPEIDGILVY